MSSQCFSDQRDESEAFVEKTKTVTGKKPGQKRMRTAARDRNNPLNADFNCQIKKGNPDGALIGAVGIKAKILTWMIRIFDMAEIALTDKRIIGFLKKSLQGSGSLQTRKST